MYSTKRRTELSVVHIAHIAYNIQVSYAIGSRKLLANEQFFVGAQTVVSLLQTTQICSVFVSMSSDAKSILGSTEIKPGCHL